MYLPNYYSCTFGGVLDVRGLRCACCVGRVVLVAEGGAVLAMWGGICTHCVGGAVVASGAELYLLAGRSCTCYTW
jgi:hypothetical protein